MKRLGRGGDHQRKVVNCMFKKGTWGGFPSLGFHGLKGTQRGIKEVALPSTEDSAFRGGEQVYGSGRRWINGGEDKGFDKK